ncbi:hypothetical protein INQ40_08640 [Lysobacter sp. H21R4]|uniref:hypothetical protein n=1 Tax=Lysobacter sp. H21R4 TaxID=2781021 RepID=UPI0018870B52|nr:hypothetical protein [Lysobacter sp. H21R4]QOY62017.1 hypothetical protein INQ40_08640 [Lysobacter sp. H21R4]
MNLKWMFAVVALVASGSAFAQAAVPAVEMVSAQSASANATPASMPASAESSANAKARGARNTMWIAAGVALGAVIINNINDSSDDRPSSP